MHITGRTSSEKKLHCDDSDVAIVQAALRDSGAETTQAVSNMLEILPAGMHKWVGMEVLLKALRLDASQVVPPARRLWHFAV